MSDLHLAELISRWRRTADAGDSNEKLGRTRRLIADELENELLIDRSADLGALRLAAEWRRYAEQLRHSKRVLDRLTDREYGDLILPEPIESAEDQARLFDEAAAQLHTLIEGARGQARRREIGE